jgi:hypothetical protein
MKYRLVGKAEEEYPQLPPEVRTLFKKQVANLLRDLHYPSLKAKKYSEIDDYWQARITREWRFYFFIIGDTYLIHEIKKHPK